MRSDTFGCVWTRSEISRKRLHGAKLDGAKHFQKNCQNVPGAAGAAVGAAAGAAAASAVCIYYVTRCTYLGAACKTLARKLWVGSWKSYGQARAAKRKTKAIVARFLFAFCRSNAVSERAKKKQRTQSESRTQ